MSTRPLNYKVEMDEESKKGNLNEDELKGSDMNPGNLESGWNFHS